MPGTKAKPKQTKKNPKLFDIGKESVMGNCSWKQKTKRFRGETLGLAEGLDAEAAALNDVHASHLSPW